MRQHSVTLCPFLSFLEVKRFSRVPADHTNLRINSNMPDFNGVGVGKVFRLPGALRECSSRGIARGG